MLENHLHLTWKNVDSYNALHFLLYKCKSNNPLFQSKMLSAAWAIKSLDKIDADISLV